MPTDPPPVPATATADTLPARAEAEIATARGYVEASRAASTRKAYEADWRRFSTWCRGRDSAASEAGDEGDATPALPASPLPAAPALAAIYLSVLAARGQASPSVARALAAIAHAHKRAGMIPPHRAEGGAVIADVLAGIRRSRTSSPDRKTAADGDIVMQLLWSITGDDAASLRGRALIALGMALAARRSELVALDVADLAWEDKGLRVTIRRSKTDQEGQGAVVAVPEGRRLPPCSTCAPCWTLPASLEAQCSGRCGRVAGCVRHGCPTVP